jgi:hypothetical protein
MLNHHIIRNSIGNIDKVSYFYSIQLLFSALRHPFHFHTKLIGIKKTRKLYFLVYCSLRRSKTRKTMEQLDIKFSSKLRAY